MSEDVNLRKESKVNCSVLHILVVGFHHQRGAEVEFVYPEFTSDNLEKGLPIPWRPLLHLALPDGAHNFDEDFVCFKLPCIDDRGIKISGNVYGVSCFQQIDSKELKVKENDITRTSVQKSVVIILKTPLYGFVLSKLSLITQAYFSERDFSQTTILKDTYLGLNHSISSMKLSDGIFHMGLSLMDLVLQFKEKIVFWGYQAGKVSKSILSLVSLFPEFFKARVDGILLSSEEKVDQISKDQYGLPMDLFGEEYAFQPYLSLQQMNLLKFEKVKAFLVGASNILYKHQTHCKCDVLVDLETNELTIYDPVLCKQVALTTEDLRFTEFILTTVAEYDTDSGFAWDGSDDWIRIQFKYYILCLLASVAPEKGNFSHINRQFNDEFIAAWKQTNNFKKWCRTKHQGLENIHLGHPFEGSLTISDIRLRIRSRLGSMSLSEESREKIGTAVQKTGQAFGLALNSAKTALTSWKGWFTGIVQEINDEMQVNSRNIDFANSNEQEVNASTDEFSYGMTISNQERTGRK